MICECNASLSIPAWPPSHLFLTSPFFFFLLLGIPTRFSTRLLLHFPNTDPPPPLLPFTPTPGPAYPESKKEKFNICSNLPLRPRLLLPSTSKQITPESKKKKKGFQFGDAGLFFCSATAQHSIPILAFLHANLFFFIFKQLLHRLTVIRSFLPIHI